MSLYCLSEYITPSTLLTAKKTLFCFSTSFCFWTEYLLSGSKFLPFSTVLTSGSTPGLCLPHLQEKRGHLKVTVDFILPSVFFQVFIMYNFLDMFKCCTSFFTYNLFLWPPQYLIFPVVTHISSFLQCAFCPPCFLPRSLEILELFLCSVL